MSQKIQNSKSFKHSTDQAVTGARVVDDTYIPINRIKIGPLTAPYCNISILVLLWLAWSGETDNIKLQLSRIIRDSQES